MKPSTLVILALLPLACGAPSPDGQGSSTSSAPAAQKAAPAPPPRVRLDVPAGTRLPVEIQTTLSSDTSREGDSIVAVLTESIPLTGFTLDKGAEVRGRVFTSVPAKRVKGRARLVFGFESVMEKGETLSITTEPIDTTGRSTGSKDKKIIGGSALGGLIIGAIKDGTKGAAIGTAIGAAAGGGTVLVMKGHEVEIPRGARLTLTVTK